MIFSLRVPGELEIRLREVAKARYMSLNSLILQVLADSPLLQGVQVPEVPAVVKKAPEAVSEPLARPSKAERRAITARLRAERRK